MTGELITRQAVEALFPPRDPESHKGSYGRLLAAVGSDGMPGAALLCGEAALRCGVGLLTVATPRSVYPILAAALPEATYLPLEGDGSDAQPLHAAQNAATAVVLGCGLGRSAEAEALVWELLTCGTAPLILDADGINAVSLHIDRLKTVRRPLVLTPHPGEMARLTGLSGAEIQSRRGAVAQGFAEEYGVTLVLKGHGTLIAAPGAPLLHNPTGNPGMATGGSGDVLAGMIGSFLAQGMAPREAAVCGVYLHGLAGDRAAARLSQHSLLPRDLIAELGGLFSDLEKQVPPYDPTRPSDLSDPSVSLSADRL